MKEFFLNQKSKKGLTGLQNLGNTCFMSSVVQCLMNTEPLIKFFLYEVFLEHINKENSYGTRGKLALAFGELAREMYLGENSAIAPWDLKSQIARKAI